MKISKIVYTFNNTQEAEEYGKKNYKSELVYKRLINEGIKIATYGQLVREALDEIDRMKKEEK